jgi:hypothetical protein
MPPNGEMMPPILEKAEKPVNLHDLSAGIFNKSNAMNAAKIIVALVFFAGTIWMFFFGGHKSVQPPPDAKFHASLHH